MDKRRKNQISRKDAVQTIGELFAYATTNKKIESEIVNIQDKGEKSKNKKLTSKKQKENISVSSRNIKLMREYSTRFNIKLPKEIKQNFCKKCNAILIVGKNCRIRIKPGKKPLRIITCLECNTPKRIGFSKKELTLNKK